MTENFPHGKVPQFAIEPSHDPVLAGSRPGDAPQNAHRGNRSHLDPGMSENHGNGGHTQGGHHILAEREADKKAGESSTAPSSSSSSGSRREKAEKSEK